MFLIIGRRWAVFAAACFSLWLYPRSARSQTYSDCKANHPNAATASASGPVTLGPDVELTATPDKNSTVYDFDHIKPEWIGEIENGKGGSYPALNVDPSGKGSTCIWLYTRVGPHGAWASLIGSQRTVYAKYVYVCKEDSNKPPYAHWTHPAGCPVLYRYTRKKRRPEQIVGVARDAILSDNAPWLSCASNGCCRVQP